MTHAKLRVFLIGEGVKIAEACMDGYLAAYRVRQAEAKFTDAIERLMQHADEIEEMPAEEQWECFVESCRQAGFNPHHPAFESQRRKFERVRLEEQRDNADLN